MKQLLQTMAMLIAMTLSAKAQLVAHYSFENGSGIDIGGNGLNASYTDLVDTTDHFGMPHQAAFFTNGNQTGAVIPHNSLLNFTNQISIVAWIKPDELPGVHKIVDKIDGTSTGNFELDIYNGILRFWVASGHVEQTSQTMIEGRWYHVVATYDGADAKLYINGQLVVSSLVTGNLVANTSNMMIGFGQNGWDGFWGSMDDLKIYGNTLSNTNIADMYNSEVGMISKWSFNNGNANDEIGSDNGTVNGATLTTDRFGNTNQAYSFDGVNDEIDFDGSGFDAADFSISFWVKTAIHNYKTIVSKWLAGNGGFQFEDYSPNLRGTIYTNNTSIARGVMLSAISTGNWHHIVLTNRFNDSASLYIDGTRIGTDATSFAGQTITGTPRLFLGATNANTNNFAGDIDDVFVYNRALTDAEITALYTEGNWGCVPTSSWIDVPICEGELYSFGGVSLTEAGTYYDTLTNANGCDSIARLDLSILLGTHNNEAQAADSSYTWHGTVYTESGVYTYQYNNENTCPSTDTLHLTINGTTRINDISKTTVHVYPNPFSDKLETANEIAYQLYNVLGQEVYNSEHKENLSALPKGIYVLKSTVGTAKVVKE